MSTLNRALGPGLRPLLARTFADVADRPSCFTYDERLQVSVDGQGRPVVTGGPIGLETFTESGGDRADPIDPSDLLDTVSKATADPADPVASTWLWTQSDLETSTRAGSDSDTLPRVSAVDIWRERSGGDAAQGVVPF